jgi:hypothetical protein
MKRKIFDVLMGFKADVIRSLQHPSIPHNSNKVMDCLEDVDQSKNELEPLVLPEDATKESAALVAKVVSVRPETRYFLINDGEDDRKIAYTISGDMNGKNILLCLPGLLETKASFMVIHAYFLKFDNCKIISIDFSGRGQSDNITDQEDYKMSLYLSDISRLIKELILVSGRSTQKLTILGTSMGGVLAMYLTQIFGKKIYGIILNDIALTVNWTSLYTLYKSMKNDLGFREVRELAKELSVDERVVSDVQLPGHFDLSYQADVWGMNFHEALEGFKGKVSLIYGSDSKICTKLRVEEAKTYMPHLQTIEVIGAGHPAPFNLQVCEFIQTEMSI